MSTNSNTRYSAEDLAEFKAVILEKIESAKAQFQSLQSQINEIAESSEDEHGTDMMDDSSVTSGVELLSTMANRQRSYIRDLNNALARIKNGVYGICSRTGKLIDKRRLLLVPTTMKSVEAKLPEEKEKMKRATATRPKHKSKPKSKSKMEAPKIITKVIKRTKVNGDPIPPVVKNDFLDDDDDDDLIELDAIDDSNYEGEDDYDGDETPKNIIRIEGDEDDDDFDF